VRIQRKKAIKKRGGLREGKRKELEGGCFYLARESGKPRKKTRHLNEFNTLFRELRKWKGLPFRTCWTCKKKGFGGSCGVYAENKKTKLLEKTLSKSSGKRGKLFLLRKKDRRRVGGEKTSGRKFKSAKFTKRKKRGKGNVSVLLVEVDTLTNHGSLGQ